MKTKTKIKLLILVTLAVFSAVLENYIGLIPSYYWGLLLIGRTKIKQKELQEIVYQLRDTLAYTDEGEMELTEAVELDGWISELDITMSPDISGGTNPDFEGFVIMTVSVHDLSVDAETTNEFNNKPLPEMLDATIAGALAPTTNIHVLLFPFTNARETRINRKKKVNIPVIQGQILRVRYAINDLGNARTAGNLELAGFITQRVSPYARDRVEGSSGMPVVFYSADSEASWISPCKGRVQNVRLFAQTIVDGDMATFGKINPSLEHVGSSGIERVSGKDFISIMGEAGALQTPYWATEYDVANWSVEEGQALTLHNGGSFGAMWAEFDFIPLDNEFELKFNITAETDRITVPFDIYVSEMSIDAYAWDATEFLTEFQIILTKPYSDYWNSVNDSGHIGMLGGGPQFIDDMGWMSGREVAKLLMEAESQYSGATKHASVIENQIEPLGQYIPAGSYFRQIYEDVFGTAPSFSAQITLKCNLGKILNTPLGNFIEIAYEDEYA